jgi:signal transduction histidine kinase
MQVSRERFFAMTNHELRNALTAVHGWTELWIRKTAPDTPRAAIEVRESAERSLNLLEDLLDLSRLDADKLEPVVADHDVWDVVREAVATVEPAAERRGVRVRVTGPDGPINARTDHPRVRQILINLLTNAVRHSPAGEAIDVEVRQRDGELRFDVVDRGEGIASEQQAIIFEAFERAGKESQRGTGLGLALSRKLARLLGGDLRVESQPGKGARFYLQLPRQLTRSASS